MRNRPFFAAAILISIGMLTTSVARIEAQTYSVAGAMVYQNARNWQGLLSYATAWTKADPNNGDAWGFVGTTYYPGLNEPDKAIPALQRCVAIQPGNAPAWHALGVDYILNKQYGPAVDAIKKAIAINPNQPTYYNNLAVAYSGGNAVKSALATLDQEKALAAKLNNANVWWALGNGYAKLTDLNSAIAAYKALLQLQPNFAQGWTNLGVVLQYSGDIAGAKAAYQKGQQYGDPLASQDAAQMNADLQAQAQNKANVQSNIAQGLEAAHMLAVMHMTN